MNEDEIPISHQHAHRQTCLVNVLRETKTLSNNSSHFKLSSNKASVWTFLLSVNIYISNVIRMKVITMRLAHLKICNRFSEFETDRVHTRSKALEASGNLKVNSSIDWQYFPWNLSTCDTWYCDSLEQLTDTLSRHHSYLQSLCCCLSFLWRCLLPPYRQKLYDHTN